MKITTLIALLLIAGCHERKPLPVFDVRDYGGSQDSAAKAAYDSGGGIVVIPPAEHEHPALDSNGKTPIVSVSGFKTPCICYLSQFGKKVNGSYPIEVMYKAMAYAHSHGGGPICDTSQMVAMSDSSNSLIYHPGDIVDPRPQRGIIVNPPSHGQSNHINTYKSHWNADTSSSSTFGDTSSNQSTGFRYGKVMSEDTLPQIVLGPATIGPSLPLPKYQSSTFKFSLAQKPMIQFWYPGDRFRFPFPPSFYDSCQIFIDGDTLACIRFMAKEIDSLMTRIKRLDSMARDCINRVDYMAASGSDKNPKSKPVLDFWEAWRRYNEFYYNRTFKPKKK